MSSKISALVYAEHEKLDASIPLRVVDDHRHHTWAYTFYSRPELYFLPESVEEIQHIVKLARRCRRRLVVVGSGHSPSDLTCSSSWMINLDNFNDIIRANHDRSTLLVQAGISLRDLNEKGVADHGVHMRNLGSIDDQSIAGAIATGTHGSSLRHGLLSHSVKGLSIVLANGRAVWCSPEQNVDLFRAAQLSLGALGIVVQIELEVTKATNIEYTKTMMLASSVLDSWNGDLWTSSEFCRVWWLPYTKRAVVWKADKTDKPEKPAPASWYGGAFGYHTYHTLLWISNYIPSLLPVIERVVFGLQHGFRAGASVTAVEPMHKGLLLDCLYSQLVNEWAIPLHRGQEALERLTAWIHHDASTARIPVDSRGIHIHAPIEVRVSDTTLTSSSHPRAYFDPSYADGPSLYLNATLYRAYGNDPPNWQRYYEAFEYLMKDLGGRPHWAKNFVTIDRGTIEGMYSASVNEKGESGVAAFRRVRSEVDPDGMFTGAWHRRLILPPTSELPSMALEEKETSRVDGIRGGGTLWVGEQAVIPDPAVSSVPKNKFGNRGTGPASRSSTSEESFDLMHGAEAEASQMMDLSGSDTEKEEDI